MIKSWPQYEPYCDHCYGAFGLCYESEAEAKQAALESGWAEIDGGDLVCQSCHDKAKREDAGVAD